jgi:hypothetical protein
MCCMSSSKRLTYTWAPYALAVFRALAARNGLEDFRLFVGTGVLDKVPDVDDAIGAGVVGAIEVRDRRDYVRDFDVLRRSAGE